MLNGSYLALAGSTASKVVPILLPAGSFNTVGGHVLNDATAIHADLVAAGTTQIVAPAATAADNDDVEVHHTLDLPPKWAPRALAHPTFPPAEFYTEFI